MVAEFYKIRNVLFIKFIDKKYFICTMNLHGKRKQFDKIPQAFVFKSLLKIII